MPRPGIEAPAEHAYIPPMRDLNKIATCCYCGSRTVLTLSGKVQHELACASCGAKLHNMKPLKVATQHGKKPKLSPKPAYSRPSPKPKPKKKSKRKDRFGDLFEDLFDVIEDIFD